MIIGVVGAPNKGKSTLFSAATLVDAQIADYPFTTIDPNRGVTYARCGCPHVGFGLPKCDARNSKCDGGVRLIPINMIDVAGLVPGAHAGRGMGNQFLGDLAQADVLIQVVDASGRSDVNGNAASGADVCDEIRMLREEMDQWFKSVLLKNWSKIKGKGLEGVALAFSGMNISASDCEAVAGGLGLPVDRIEWSEEQALAFCRKVREKSKPIVIAANKADLPGANENVGKLRKEFPGMLVVPTCAALELALRKGAAKGVIKYVPGAKEFEVLPEADQRQREGLAAAERMLKACGSDGTGVQALIDSAVFEYLGLVEAYPVEDENRYCDKKGAVLPDAYLLRRGSTVFDLAGKVHTDLQAHFIGAINAKTKMRIGRDTLIARGDVIKIIAGR